MLPSSGLLTPIGLFILMKVFFGKISDKFDPVQLVEGYYKAKRTSTWFNGIDVGDYCFMVGGGKIQLWKARQWNTKNNDDVLQFDILSDDLKINTIKLTSFKYFKLTVPLIVLTVRSTGKSQRAFFQILTEDHLTEEILVNTETYKDKNNYRNVWLHSSEDKIKKGLVDLQLYRGNSGWQIYKSDFILENVFEYFRDNTPHTGNGQTNKDKTLNLVQDQKNWDKPLEPYQVSLLNIYDAFCCDYKKKEDEDSESETDITKYWVVGATWDGIDKSPEFIANGEWKNGYGPESGDKSVDKVRDIQVGDSIAIKSRWGNLGIIVKAVGTVTKKEEDGRHLKVDWVFKGPAFNLRNVHKIQTVHQITESNEIKLIFKNGYKSSEADTTKKEAIPMSKNLIFWGPPGTGKTFTLLKLQERFKAIKNEKNDQLTSWIQDLKWWETIAAALIESGNKPGKVDELLDHPFVKLKVHMSSSVQPDKTMWGNLQTHTVDSSKTVNVAKRISPQIFNKNNDSEWFLEKGWEEQIPALKAEVEKYKNGKLDNKDRFEMVTFHQSYSYEEFVEGIRPYKSEDGTAVIYDVKPGVFQRICQRASQNPDLEYAIFIDEINRGNISKIFGELITLIEEDKRAGAVNATKVTLPYSNSDFSVPSNLYIFGTMNSVDRSVALVDMALRRRFTFQSLKPQKEHVLADIEDVPLRAIFEKLNDKISVILGNEYQIGHSYLLNSKVNDLESLKSAWFGCILPLLQEYLFDDWEKLQALVKDFVVCSEEIADLKGLPLPRFTFGKFIEAEDVSEQKFKDLLKKLA